MTRTELSVLWFCAAFVLTLARSVLADSASGAVPLGASASASDVETDAPPAGSEIPATLLRPPQVVAASVCWLEASFAVTDCAALLHVLLRRAERSGVTWQVMAWRYSALRRDHDRARLARSLPDGDEPTWTAPINRRWADLRATAAGVLDGTVPDPCPGATQWGGMALPHDRARARAAVASGRWVYAACAGRTANTFFREMAR